MMYSLHTNHWKVFLNNKQIGFWKVSFFILGYLVSKQLANLLRGRVGDSTTTSTQYPNQRVTVNAVTVNAVTVNAVTVNAVTVNAVTAKCSNS